MQNTTPQVIDNRKQSVTASYSGCGHVTTACLNTSLVEPDLDRIFERVSMLLRLLQGVLQVIVIRSRL